MFIARYICVIITIVLFISPSVCLATQDNSETTTANSSENVLEWDGFRTEVSETKDATQINLVKQFMLAIGFVALLGCGTFYFSKKVAPKLSASKGKSISIVDSVSLGQNKTLHIVEIDNKKLLIGSTPQSINTLAELPGSFQEVLQTCQDDTNEL